MSNLNLKWLANNFAEAPIIFDIGCADMGDTIAMKKIIPNASFYAFECNWHWLDSNLKKAEKYHINYYHIAMSDKEGETQFFASHLLDGQEWPWSGSLMAPSKSLLTDRWEWSKPYAVKTTTIKNFCDLHDVNPSFIHIDVQGAEQKILTTMGKYRPLAIWAEVCEFYSYETGTTYEKFNEAMNSLDYSEVYKDNNDSLYVHKSANLTPYKV